MDRGIIPGASTSLRGCLYEKEGLKSYQDYQIENEDTTLNPGEAFSLVKKILGNYRILKILHGSEALDIPYMFNDLIQSTKYIIRFTNSFIDTRYICEYYNLENNLKDRKCKIYDFLLDHQIIDSKKVEELEKNSNDMGPIYDIIISIYNITYDQGNVAHFE